MTIASSPKTCGHGVLMTEKFCRECSLVWCREMLAIAERNAARLRAEIVELENMKPCGTGRAE